MHGMRQPPSRNFGGVYNSHQARYYTGQPSAPPRFDKYGRARQRTDSGPWVRQRRSELEMDVGGHRMRGMRPGVSGTRANNVRRVFSDDAIMEQQPSS